MKERSLIGEGSEHIVYRSCESRYVVKVPKKPVCISSMLLMRHSVGLVRQDYSRASNLIEGTGILIPHSRIFKFGVGYVMLMEYVAEDNSVNIPDFLIKLNNSFFSNEYHLAPKNFITNKGSVYWIDFTHGVSRIPDRLRLINRARFNELRIKFRF